ncbi:hypothetical protein KL909_000106 [Ogataea angusta]|nr:hypothetical protein KL909_000106 [Ogataea angusta]
MFIFMDKNTVTLKVGLVGDAQVGKTSLMVKYVENCFDEVYTQTLGVNYMERSINIKTTEITFSIWDLGGEAEFTNMLPLVASDAVARVQQNSHTVPGGHEVRPVCGPERRGAGGDHETGPEVCAGDECAADLLLDQCLDQHSKDLQDCD